MKPLVVLFLFPLLVSSIQITNSKEDLKCYVSEGWKQIVTVSEVKQCSSRCFAATGKFKNQA